MRTYLLALAILFAGPAYAEDVVLTHQLRVLDPTGAPITGSETITVELFEDDQTSSSVWVETFDANLEQGFVTLKLGMNPSNALPGETAALVRYAQVSIAGEALGGRQRLSSVPLAAHSLSAGSVQGDVTVDNLQLQTESSGTCTTSSDYGKMRWNGTTFQGCRPGGWSNMLMAEPGNAGTTGMVQPPGLIAYFEGACPDGWTEKTSLRGRVVVAATATGAAGTTVGAALADGAGRTITEAPQHGHGITTVTATSTSAGNHGHTVDPPSTRSGNQTANHTHTVNPPNASTSAGGNHRHAIRTRQDDWNVSGGPGTGRPSWGEDNGPLGVHNFTDFAGNHGHTVDIPQFNSGTISTSHQHDLNIPSFSSGIGGAHAHTVTVSGQQAVASGPASVDVTMPYIHLIGCELE